MTRLSKMGLRAAVNFAAWGTLMALVCAMLVGCHKRPERQSKVLDDQTRVTLVDAWILKHTPELLQVWFTY